MPRVTMNIKREFFAAIVAGRKPIEYRDLSPYWETRFAEVGKGPFILHLRNGITHPIPTADVVVTELERDKRVGKFRLHLGDVICTTNWDRVKERPMKDKK